MLARLIARDYRNFVQLDVDVPPGGLAIVGDNGQGKTNLLEAVAFFSLMRSMRGARDSDVIRFGAPAFHLRAETRAPAPHHAIAIGYERQSKRKRAQLDGVDQPRLANALGALPSVGFSPADVSLVTGGPGERRRFLDVALALSSARYLAALQQYRALLSRRNAELRHAQREHARAGGASEERVAVWEEPLAEHGGTISAMRSRFVRMQQERFALLVEQIGEAAPASMRYADGNRDQANADVVEDAHAQAERLRVALQEQRRQEMRRGISLVGPHRDDLQLLLNGRDLRTFGSAGQQRTAAIAMRLIELSTLREARGMTPLLLLDDPFAELDSSRATRVLSLLEGEALGQVLLAVPRAEEVPAAFTRLERRTMRGGVIE